MSNVIEQAVMALELKLDRGEWSLVKFGDVAVKQNKSVDRENTHLKHYVKGEHMLSEDLHLREWGELADEYLGPAFIRYFEEGDILYGSRRTYLRKVTIAPFEGITSNTTFVIKANEDVIDQRLLPFIMLSEEFSQHSIRNSKGSVNPYVNWKDIANYEFLLPPKAQQAEIAELLWAMDEVIQKENKVLQDLDAVTFVRKREFFINGNGQTETQEFGSFKAPKNWSIEKMSTVANVEYGISKSVANNTDPKLGWQIITGANIALSGSFDMSKKRYIEIPEKDRFFLQKGDLMFNWRSGSPEHIGKTAYFDLDGYYTYASFILRIRCGDRLRRRYTFFLLNFLRDVEFFTRNISKQINFKINASIFREIEIPIPPIKEQDDMLYVLEFLFRQRNEIASHILHSVGLQKSLINQVF